MGLPDVILLNIIRTYKADMTEEELYEATRGAWRININNARTIKYAVAIAWGMVQEVYEIKSWHSAGTFPYKTRLDLNKENLSGQYSGRKEFVGKVANGDIRDKLIGLEVNYWWQNPVRYINLGEL